MKTSSTQGIYLYCIADSNEKVSLGKIGIDNGEVHTVPYQGIAAVVHECKSHPYESEDTEKVKNWIITHQKVIDCAWERFGTVLPFAFDTIIIGQDGVDSKMSMEEWLQKDCQKLKEKLNEVRGKAEYGVQILWDPEVMVERIAQDTPEITSLREELKSKPPGTAYMYEEKIKSLLRREMETKADGYFKEFYARIKERVFDTSVGKAKKVEDNLQMLMNLSCLVVKGNVRELGLVLEQIEQEDGVIVRFTGPWPPYSFV